LCLCKRTLSIGDPWQTELASDCQILADQYHGKDCTMYVSDIFAPFEIIISDIRPTKHGTEYSI